MAVYTNLAVDCADVDSVADQLHGIYCQLSLSTREFGTVNCDVEHIKPNRHWGQPEKVANDAGNWHTLCVSPNGIGNGTPLSDSLIDELRLQLYEPLKQGYQFRSAWFGWEAQDALGEIDWPEILQQMNSTGIVPDMPGLILSADSVTNPDAKSCLKPFCSGYFWHDPSIAGQ